MMKKRIFSLLLTVAMLISTLPVIANAADQPKIAKTSLTLDGVIGLNVKVDSHSNDMSNYKVKVTIDGDSASQVIDEPSTELDTGRYVYTAKLPAHKLPKAVKIELLDSSDTPVDTMTGWTAANYLTEAVKIDSGLADLAAALNLYGANAAAYGTSAGSAPAQAVEQSDLESHRFELVQGSSTLNPCAELRLHYACAIRVTFAQTEWENGGYTFLFDGQEKAVQLDTANHVYYYETDAIKVQDWSTKYNVKVVKTDAPTETVFECNYGALSYVYTALGLSEERTVGEGNLLKAMFRYYETADGYAKADRYDYSVTYNANYEGSEATKQDEENATNITAASKEFTVDANTFERTGYTFDGWNTEADGTGTPYAAGDKLTVHSTDGAVVLYAQWKSVAQGEVTLVNEDFSNGFPSGWLGFDNNGTATDNWTVADDAAKYTGDDKSNNKILLADTNVNFDNYTLTADVRIPDSSTGSGGRNVGFVFACDDTTQNFHFVRIMYNGSAYTLYIGYTTNKGANLNTFGSSSTVSSKVSSYAGQNATLKVVVAGANIKVYIGDEMLGEQTSTKASSLQGKAGFFIRGDLPANAFDNFKVTSPDLLLYENFNSMTTVPSTWAAVNQSGQSGSWGVTDGALQYTGDDANSGGKTLVFDTPINEDNYEISAKVRLFENTTGKSIGFVFASNDEGTNFHYFRIWSNSNYIISAGSASTLASLKTDILNAKGTTGLSSLGGTVIDLKLKVEGTKFTIYVNDKVQQTGTTTAANLHGKVGVLLRGNVSPNAYDDIMVEKITVTAG